MAIEIPATASAATLLGPYGEPYQFLQKPVPQPSPGEAIVLLSFSGVCHGDVYSRDGGGPAPTNPIRPLIGGHEGVGNIVALGEKVHDSSFRIGDLVGIAWRTAGIDIPQACCVLCAGVTAFSSLRLMNPKPGEWCTIAGAAGGLGHLAIQYAKTFGLKVVAIDGGQPEKEAFCKEMGADIYIDFAKEGSQLVQKVKTVTNGGSHLVLVFSPHQSSYNDAGEYARFGGQIMAVGIGNCSSNQTGTKDDIIEALKLSVSGQVNCNVEVMKLGELNEALDKLQQGKVLGKIVVDLKSST
ncbi:hypothetical protein B7463_g9024, partial [Scytalidium lignicola]